ncbi:MAG: YdcF family protein [Rhodospirillales bacterium]|nr:MAG: YdcF family protein [Rhodospirillales bacterium]
MRLKRPRVRAAIVVLAVMIGASWTAGLIAFAVNLPGVVVDPASRTEAIVVLTGGSKRLDTGLRLLSEDMADRVFVSGVHRDVNIEELLRVTPDASEDLACCVDVGHGALDTIGNATETAAWIRARGYRSLRLVTASYHMPRSLLELRSALPEATVIPHPVFPPDVKLQQWWRWPGTAALVAREYNKYLVAWGRLALNERFGHTVRMAWLRRGPG